MSRNDPFKPRVDECSVLLDRPRLIRRWQHGSDAFFWRHEKRGALIARGDDAKVRYRWKDVFEFEGGQPPDGMAEAYACDLLTERQVAGLFSVAPSFVLNAARRKELPARRIGRAYRFVPAEVAAWQARRFVNRKSLNSRRNSKNE